ncbi:hypothetical protein LAZ67_4003911 [Cordylochernes scorpioides]|uniref:Uncharacterized protein n=1 Tax=Cordylochernes scorpioides TaxID=51811 RepID=A0ABY6KFY6_9ARAC|nr:hypothetical protein LAZ67_4003911 [Cordylochernes scorpioides]
MQSIDTLKRARAPKRAIFTRLSTEFWTEIEKPDFDTEKYRAKYNRICALSKEISEIDSRYQGLLLEDETITEVKIEEEFEGCENYVQGMFDIENKYLSWCETARVRADGSLVKSAANSVVNNESKRNIRLPKVELPKFKGNLEDWLSWWGQFSKISDDETLGNVDKFHYLLQAVVEESRAQRLVCSYPITEDNYLKVIIQRNPAVGYRIKEGTENGDKSDAGGRLQALMDFLRGEVKGAERMAFAKENFEDLVALDQPENCARIPPLLRGRLLYKLKRKNIYIHPSNFINEEIDIFIGSDYFGQLLTGKVVHLGEDLTAVDTKLGWTLMRQSPVVCKEDKVQIALNMLVARNNLKDLWELDVLGIQDLIERDEDQRYSVALPLKCERNNIPSNLEIAQRRLEACTSKLRKEKRVIEYSTILQEWEREGLIERVEENRPQKKGHYSPHRPVFKAESRTTPLRPVFDASCRSYNGLSLNDYLEKGPNLLEKIPEILIRFREKGIGVIADIRKAFQMITVQLQDQDFLRFLWRDQTDPMKFTNTAANIMEMAKMDLRELEFNLPVSNSKEEKGTTTKVLGLVWDKVEDVLNCDVSIEKDLPRRLTKRIVLSKIQQVFDPLGVYSPIFLPPKLLLQRSWELKIGWDSQLPEDMDREFRTWYSQIGLLTELPSRGCSIVQFVSTNWWEGPEWLKREKESWPSFELTIYEEEIIKEKRKTLQAHTTLIIEKNRWFLDRRSKYSLNIRIMAWVLRFLDNRRRIPIERGNLKVIELERAERKLLKLVQQDSFPGKQAPKNGLKTIKSVKGLWCVETKLLHGQDPEVFKRPILLPRNHPLVEQMVREIHQQNRHGGAQFILSQLREKFWIIGGRRLIKQIIGKCVICRRHNQKPIQTPGAALPTNRIGLGKPFEVTGVDLLGPLHLKGCSKRFRKEYLGVLMQRAENKRERCLKEGDLVLIGQDNTKRILWPVGKIVKLYLGKDGVNRVAKVKTSTGEWLRPVQRLFPFEISSEETPKKAYGDKKKKPLTIKTRSGREVRKPIRFAPDVLNQ